MDNLIYEFTAVIITAALFVKIIQFFVQTYMALM